MAKSKLVSLMSHDLPNITSQKRLLYRTDEREVKKLFRLINREIFNGALPTPNIEVHSYCKMYWGICSSKNYTIINPNNKKSECTIRVSDKWFCKQWLITTLAHEMCHQYQWDILGKKRVKCGLKPLMSHGSSFFIYKEKLARHGIPLKTAMRKGKWFKSQNMFKC